MELLNGDSQGLRSFLQGKLDNIRVRRGDNMPFKFKTDLGYLTSENLEYLLTDQKLLVKVGDEYGIRNAYIDDSKFSRPVQYLSLFLFVKEEIENSTGIKEINAIVDVMRNGINNSFQKYAQVENIAQRGKFLAFKALERRGGKYKKSSSDYSL